MVEARPHLLTYSIGDDVMVLVVEVLVDVLGLLQAVADVFQELIVVSHVLGNGGHLRLTLFI